MLGETYPAFLATGGIRQHPKDRWGYVDGCRSVRVCPRQSEVREFAQSKFETCWIGLRPRRSAQPGCGLNLLERRLAQSHTTVIIPLDDRVIFVTLLNCAKFSSRLSKVAQTLNAISRIQFLVGGRGFGERWPLGTV
jgi:hypothetical protein